MAFASGGAKTTFEKVFFAIFQNFLTAIARFAARLLHLKETVTIRLSALRSGLPRHFQCLAMTLLWFHIQHKTLVV